MKKILTFIIVAVTAMTFVSCDDDKIARSLDGIWEGQVSSDYFNYRLGNSYQWIDIQFYADPSRYAKGSGIERDYFGSVNGYYKEFNFDFEVRGGYIYLYYEDGIDVVIRDYELVDDRFSGEFLDSDGRHLASFDLYRVTSWRYNRYNYERYTANPDSTATFEEVKDTIK
ncbi:MAG: hypothetical protein J5932_01560 [Prevotella sp.]|nr:hypothetical protein [Prevotella sp.]